MTQNLNLITDPWIPASFRDGTTRLVAPYQIADRDITGLCWERPDMKAACHELLIGLVYMAGSGEPLPLKQWTPDILRDLLMPYAPAFNLLGDGPRFMQDFDNLPGEPSPVDMLFIDSAGAQTAKNNTDLMVHRNRYGVLSLPEAAMALYTLQAFAPSGGAGNRTSMRGGGPLITLVTPYDGTSPLWDTIALNVPKGIAPFPMEQLPWMKPCRTSEKGKGQTVPPAGEQFNAEAFFGVPRRLRLVSEGDFVTGVIQRPYGTDYGPGWVHPLTPYYLDKKSGDWLPRHPRGGSFTYRNWPGVLIEGEDDTSRLALTMQNRPAGETVRVHVMGWDMNNMSPREYTLRCVVMDTFTEEQRQTVLSLIHAGTTIAGMLRTLFGELVGKASEQEKIRDDFLALTNPYFEEIARKISKGLIIDPAREWVMHLQHVALTLFDSTAGSCGIDRDPRTVATIIRLRGILFAVLWGRGKIGGAIFEKMGIKND